MEEEGGERSSQVHKFQMMNLIPELFITRLYCIPPKQTIYEWVEPDDATS